jgi:hypothetical protein
MPYEHDSMADLDGESLRCWVCDGNLRAETAIDLHTGFSSEVLLCLGCGRRWPGGESPRPVIAA